MKQSGAECIQAEQSKAKDYETERSGVLGSGAVDNETERSGVFGSGAEQRMVKQIGADCLEAVRSVG